MNKTSTCISIFLPVFISALAVIIWAAIFELPLVPGLIAGALIGTGIGTWYCAKAQKARRCGKLKECISWNTTLLSIILFVDLFASMLVWTAKELF